MLNTRSYSGHTGIVFIMNEVSVQAAAVKTKIAEISKQAAALAAGLQNAAPGEKDAPNPSIQYLIAIAEALGAVAGECEELINPGSKTSANDSTSQHGTP